MEKSALASPENSSAPTSAQPRSRSSLRRLLLKISLAIVVSTLTTASCLYIAEALCRWRDPHPEKFWYTYSARPLPISKFEYFEPSQLSRLQTLMAPEVRYD